MTTVPDDILIREICEADAPDLERFYEELEPETRCLRFCAASRGLSHAQSEFFCRHERDRHEGLVATQMTEGVEHIVGHLCIEPEGGNSAEVALVVAETLQHHGIGRRLVDRGAAWARTAGIRTLTATMLIGNEPIFRLLTTLGLPYRAETLGAGTCRLEIDLVGMPSTADGPRSGLVGAASGTALVQPSVVDAPSGLARVA